MHLELQTTPQVFLLLELQLLLLLRLPAPPWHHSQEHLEVDLTSHRPQHSISGLLHRLDNLLFGLFSVKSN